MACFEGSGGKTVQDTAMPEERAAKKKLYSTYMPEVGKGQPTYPGEWVAPYSPEQKAALGTIGKYTDVFAPGEMPLFGETGETLARTLRGEGGAPFITPEQTESYYKRVFEEPATRAFKKDVRPTIREAYAGPGYWSSARAGAETEATEDLWKNLGTARGGLEWDVMMANRATEEAAAQRALGATAPAMAYAGLPTQESLARLGGAGGVFQALGTEQAQRQAEIGAEIQKFLAEQRITDPEDLEIIMALLGQPYGISIGEQWGPGLGYAMFGNPEGGSAAMGAASGIAGLFSSDARIKENIKPFDGALEKIRKLKPFVYNYIGQEENRIGLIAQDVEKVLPDAVVEIDGVKHVDLYAIHALIIGAINEILGDK